MTWKRFGYLTLIAAVVAGVAIAFSAGEPPPEVQKARKEAAREYVAEAACKDLVSGNLRTTHAEFVVLDVSKVAITRGPGIQVTMDVRAPTVRGSISGRVKCVLLDSGGMPELILTSVVPR